MCSSTETSLNRIFTKIELTINLNIQNRRYLGLIVKRIKILDWLIEGNSKSHFITGRYVSSIYLISVIVNKTDNNNP